MLKVFVPQYDGPTSDNARLANDVFPNSPRHLVLGSHATRASLHALIAAHDTSALLVMAHGSSDCVFAQNDEVALNLTDIACDAGGVLRLPVFAWVCKTSIRLGPAFQPVAKSTGAWWGYRTTVSAPSPRRLAAFRDALRYITNRFHAVRTSGAASEFFRGLRDLCEHHRGAVVRDMAKSGDFRDAHEIAVALREVWQHLDALLPSLPQPAHAGLLVESIVDGV